MTTANPLRYSVIRSRRKTADIVVERDGEVVVRAPEWADDQLIEQMVHNRKYWIYKTIAEWRELNRFRSSRSYCNGEGFLYLGSTYRLTIVADAEPDLVLRDGRFQLSQNVVHAGKESAVQNAFQKFYQQKGLEKIPARVAYYAPKVGKEAGKIRITDTGHRWASCSPQGNLLFHWKCMMAPLKIIDYIVVHELCHLHHPNHSDAFWNEIDKVLPDYRERKDWLRLNGVRLDV